MGIFKVKIIPKNIVREVNIPGRSEIKVYELLEALNFVVEEVVVTRGGSEILTEYDTVREGDDIVVFLAPSGG
ncbi:MAG TPA: hypothetical protein EYH40_02200 [Desulfurococcales archaeon]|nr:hypothetical protein [Desulfurococcales archaeon]